MASLEIWADLSEWIGLLQRIKGNCTDENLLKDAGDKIRDDVREQFLQGGDPEWQPLSEMRLRIRAAKDSSNLMILIDSGHLLLSWITTEASGHIEFIESGSITIGSTVNYAGLMQYGGQNETGEYVPARPVAIREDAVYSVAESVLTNLLSGR